MFQIINADSQFTIGMKQFIQQQQTNYSNQYRVLSVIGGQSTGKSTLLNQLFGLGFPTLNSKIERKQTTQGIWVARANDYVLFDVEGSDSANRWDNQNFERFVGLFALTLSDILLINVWTTDIGRFNAAQYELLQISMQHQLRICDGNQSKKALVFALRDFDETRENCQLIRQRIKSDLQKLWKEMNVKQQFNDLFDIQILFIPNLINSQIDLKSIKNQLDSLPLQNHNPIPFKQLDIYCAQIWNIIINKKDLNLPRCRILVTKYVCDQIKNQIMNKIKYPTKIDDNINQLYQNQLKAIQLEFIQQSEGHDSNMIQQGWIELQSEYNLQYQRIIIEQLNTLQSAISTKIKDNIIELIEDNSQLEVQTCIKLENKYQQLYKTILSLVVNILDESKITQLQKQFELYLGNFILTFKQQLLTQFKQIIQQSNEKQLNSQLKKLFNEFPLDLFTQRKSMELTVLKESEQKILNFSKLYDIQTNQKHIPQLKLQIQEQIQNIMNEYLLQINYFAEQKYLKLFLFDSNMFKKQWYKYSEQQIIDLNTQTIYYVKQVISNSNNELSSQHIDHLYQHIDKVAISELDDALRKRHYHSKSKWRYILYILLIYFILERIIFANPFLLLIIIIFIIGMQQYFQVSIPYSFIIAKCKQLLL